MYQAATSNEIFQLLCNQLTAARDVEAVSSDFARLSCDRARVEYVHVLLEKFELHCDVGEYASLRKSDAESERLRALAASASVMQTALELHNRAVAYAVIGDEPLGRAYLERSELLFQMKEFPDCMEDLRRAQACAHMNDVQIRSLMQEYENAECVRDAIRRPSLPEMAARNGRIACASHAIDIHHCDVFGRSVIATRDIQVGEVLAIEEPYAAVITSEAPISITHCHQCIRVHYALIPCDFCAFAVYCSDACKLLAWSTYHQYECPIVGALQGLGLSTLNLLALRITISATPNFSEAVDVVEDDADMFRSGRYQEIHHLCRNTEHRSVGDLFRRASTAALVYNLIKEKTAFFEHHAGTESTFMDLLLRHMQTAPSNFHEIGEKLLRIGGSHDPSAARTEEIGGGAYSFLSMFNHSCAPNAVRHCHGSTLILRAILPIKPGEQVMDNYGYHYAVMPREERRRLLRSQYYFDCHCVACVQDWPTYNFLKFYKNMPDVHHEDIETLKTANRAVTLKILDGLITKIKLLERVQKPSKNLSDAQECIKECYSILANRRVVWHVEK